MIKIVKDAQIIIQITVEGTSRTRINTELSELIKDFDVKIQENINEELVTKGTEILKYSIYIASDPQLGLSSRHARQWHKGA